EPASRAALDVPPTAVDEPLGPCPLAGSAAHPGGGVSVGAPGGIIRVVAVVQIRILPARVRVGLALVRRCEDREPDSTVVAGEGLRGAGGRGGRGGAGPLGARAG